MENGHLDLENASEALDLEDKHPLNIAADDRIGIPTLSTAVLHTDGMETSTSVFVTVLIAQIETKNETSVAADVAKQAAGIGVTATTPTGAITGEPTRAAGNATGAAKRG